MGVEELRACEYWTEREGRAAVRLWQRSGEPLAVWARAAGVSRSRLSYWAKRLERSAGSAITLAPVTVVAAPTSAFVIELRSGRAVRIEGAFDDEALARVIAIAEGTC